jgi:hypothetical protein
MSADRNLIPLCPSCRTACLSQPLPVVEKPKVVKKRNGKRKSGER